MNRSLLNILINQKKLGSKDEKELMNRRLLNILHNKSFSGEDIFKCLNGNCNVMTYTDLTKFKNINDVLSYDKPLVLLYLVKSKSYGHWVCLIRHKDDHIEFFDSIGNIPDDIEKRINPALRIATNQDYPYLLYLLYKSGEKIEYNETRLQKQNKPNIQSTNTCGRWACVRCMCKDLPLKTFVKLIKKASKNGYDGDDIVTYLTRKI